MKLGIFLLILPCSLFGFLLQFLALPPGGSPTLHGTGTGLLLLGILLACASRKS